MKLSDSQKAILKGISKKLEHGDVATIAKKAGLNRIYVGSILRPKTSAYNDAVIKIAIELISEREQGRKEMLEKIPA